MGYAERNPGEPDDEPPATAEFVRLGFLDHSEPLARRRVQDPSLPEPERDMVGAAVAVRDEVSGSLRACPDRLARRLLLPGLPPPRQPHQPVAEVDEAGAVDPGGAEPAPLVRGAQEGPRDGHRIVAA